MALISKQTALDGAKRRTKDVTVPELDGELRLASMYATQTFEFEELAEKVKKGNGTTRDMAVFLLEHSAITEDGKPFFQKSEALAFVGKVSAETIALLLKEFPKADKATLDALEGKSAASRSDG